MGYAVNIPVEDFMDSSEILNLIQDEDSEIEDVFKELLSFLDTASNDECVILLRRMRSELDVDKYFLRMEQIGDLGSGNQDYQKHMIRIFNYAMKNGLSLGDLPDG